MSPRTASLVLLALLTACSSGPDPQQPASAPVAPQASASSAAPASEVLWLCRPGLADNPCEQGLDATVVDGSGTVQRFTPAAAPEVDCFYVYPTVSEVVALNAPMAVDDRLVAVARAQAARFGELCRVFAPVYRQITRSAIFTGRYEDPAARAIAEGDVLAAWRDYLANDNDGRGVVMIGHSQGARTLTALVDETVEQEPATKDLLVSALLLGGDVTVADGKDVGGSFDEVPACREPGQAGCVVAYSSFAAPPPVDSFFGRTTEPGLEVLCTDPSRLAGGSGELHPYLPTAQLVPAGSLGGVVPGVATGFAAYPEQLRGRCEQTGGASYLQVEAAPGAQLDVPPADLGPRWGLHNGDVNIALGDLVEIVRRQAAGYQAPGA